MKRSVVRIGAAVGLVAVSLSCSLYRTSDRDDFDTNGRSRAPVGAALVACVPDEAVTEEKLESLTPMSGVQWLAVAQLKSKRCQFTLDIETAKLPANELLKTFSHIVDPKP